MTVLAPEAIVDVELRPQPVVPPTEIVPASSVVIVRVGVVSLVREATAGQHGITQTPETAWGMYVRFLFRPSTFYRFTLLAERYLLVVENKSLPGRAEVGGGMAIGRYLSIAWFGVLKANSASNRVANNGITAGCDNLAVRQSSKADISIV